VVFKDGDVLEINYTIKVLENGEEKLYETTKEDIAKKYNTYDPNKKYSPMFVIVGKTRLLDPVDKAIREMNPGEKKEITIEPEEAYGPWRKELVVTIPIKRLRKAGIRPRIGEEIEAGGRKGRIIKVTERFAYIDFNHPLAGKRLKVEIEVLRRLEKNEDVVRAVVLRYLPIKREDLKVEVNEDTVTIELPNYTIVVRDLDSILQSIIADIYQLTNLKEIVFKIKIPLKREEKSVQEKEEGGEEKEANASQ